LEDQIGWYDRKRQIAQRRYKILKVAQVIIAGLIPLASVFPIPRPQWVTAVLGLLVLIIEAVQQLNQDQQNWIAYRSTCEALKHEKYLHLAPAGPYANAENWENQLALLTDRTEGLISQEHAKVGVGAGTSDGKEQTDRQPSGSGEREQGTLLNLTGAGSASSMGGLGSSADGECQGQCNGPTRPS